MSQPDAEQSLATTLFDTVKALQDHVEARAAEIAAAEIATACARHGQELAVAHHNAEIAQERADAVTGELRRLVDIRDKQLGQLRQMLREHGIDPNTGASTVRGGPLIAGFARELWAGVRDYNDLPPTGYDVLPPAEREAWEGAATHALEATVDHIIQAGRPVWWTTN
jgi:hypothetical protein